MSDHVMMIVKFQDKSDPTKEHFVALSSETSDLSEDSMWDIGHRYIGFQAPNIRWTIFGKAKSIIITECTLPLSDRLNNIVFKPVYRRWTDCENDEFLDGADPIEPFLLDQPMSEGYVFAKHYIIPSCS
uniref:Uncharacterized protein n=1 Tax=viral metagenome TaxID=1070528 RepID=A0A6C0DFJ5_9ZZZZ